MNRYGIVCLAMMMGTPTYAYQTYGICNYGKETLSSVVCYGPTVLKETKVEGGIKVTGPLRAYHVTANTITVVGPAVIENSIINGTVAVIGQLATYKADFVGDIDITGAEAVLRQSKVRGSIVLHSNQTEPHLKLQCGTAVAGSVNFSDKPGIVEVTDDSIVQGKVVNGDIAFVKSKCP
jgi:hypothetical protein